MTSARPYQPPTDVDAALAECARQAGRQFCPTVVAALCRLADDGALDAPEPGRWVETEASV
jgi:HD-GYP domain-containing protein (c-di-GMP phosphodiesterase class II)